jgi:hypothetical protein
MPCGAPAPVCSNHAIHSVLILAFAYPAFWHLIAWGQTSALALACFTLAFFALRTKREFLAGLALDVSSSNPNWESPRPSSF